MDHVEARELLEIAAVEPAGLDRLAAGDTPDAIALAGHLAGCPECTEEYRRLRESDVVLRRVIRTQPSAELRGQTLAFVAAVGRPRGTAATAPGPAALPALSVLPDIGASPVPLRQLGVVAAAALTDAPAPADAASPTAAAALTDAASPTDAPAPATAASPTAAAAAPRPADTAVAGGAPVEPFVASRRADSGSRGARARGRLPRVPMAWLAAAAAVVIVAAGVTGYAVSASDDNAVRQQSLELAGLADVAAWTVRLDAQPDVRHVVLMAATGGTDRIGTLVFSPHTQQLVVVVDGLADAPVGQEYRCWMEIAGTRQGLGRMYVSGQLAYWVGEAASLATVPAGAVFGVSLASTSSTSGGSPAILSGTLQAT